ncbi:MAG: hypothetical protein HY080_08720 [Gammaproteobacteria bacterium]|nr:hypothetical protein [Gammaproteobacteria bacterium]
MSNISCRAVLFFCGVYFFHAVDAEEFVAGGEWELTVQQDVSGLPVGLPTLIYRECLQQDQPIPKSFLQASECAVAEMKTLYRTVSWKMNCQTDHGRVYNEGKINFHVLKASGESRTYAGNVAGKNTTLRYRFTARRLGECR